MRSTQVSRRTALAGLGTAFVASSAGRARAQAAATRLRMTWWGGADRAKRTNDAVAAYVKRNPNVRVDTDTVGWGDYWTRLATQVAGGNAPDLIQMDYRYMFEYARRNTLRPLDDLIPDPLAIADFGESNLGTGRVDGKLYAVPMGINSTAMFFDRTAIEGFGLKVADLTLDWPTENSWVVYNSLQQLAYFTIVFIASPIAILTGLRLSSVLPLEGPLVRAFPEKLARSLHYPVMIFFLAFTFVHVVLVLTTGALRKLNQMYAARDADDWIGFAVFAASVVVMAVAWVLAKPPLLKRIAATSGRVQG